MSNKIYILFLGSFIACNSWGMDEALREAERAKLADEAAKTNALIKECCESPKFSIDYVCDALHPIIVAMRKEIQNDLTTLRENDALTSENLCKNIANQLQLSAIKHNIPCEKPTADYEDWTITDAYRGVVYGDILPVVLLGNKITRYIENKNGSLIAVLEQKEDASSSEPSTVQVLTIWKEMPAVSEAIIGEASTKPWLKNQITLDLDNNDRICHMILADNDTKLLCLIQNAAAEKKYISCNVMSNQLGSVVEKDKTTLNESYGRILLGYRDMNSMDDRKKSFWNAGNKCITITHNGIIITYRPTLEDIAKYLIK